MMKPLNGIIAGYDPGGNGSHGYALAKIRNGRCENLVVSTMENADAVVSDLENRSDLIALGVDTLAAWSTGPSGWRAADLWLRQRYKTIQKSIVSPNGLYGSMGINGMAVLNLVRQHRPRIHVTETHPKVLFLALTGNKYNYSENSQLMDKVLSEWIGHPVKTNNDHEWDAVVSAYAAMCGVGDKWSHDLFKESSDECGRLVFPSGTTHYWWPE